MAEAKKGSYDFNREWSAEKSQSGSQPANTGSNQANQASTSRGSQTDLSSRPLGRGESMVLTIRNWTSDTFDFNADFLKSIRGILNVCHLIISLIAFSLLAAACQIAAADGAYAGFHCRSSDTYAFVVSCSSFIISVTFVTCCILSKITDQMMFKSAFEVTYYVVYCALFLTSSLTLLSSVYARNKGRYETEDKYGTTVAGSAFGIINSILYGASSIWFLVYHRLHDAPRARQSSS